MVAERAAWRATWSSNPMLPRTIFVARVRDCVPAIVLASPVLLHRGSVGAWLFSSITLAALLSLRFVAGKVATAIIIPKSHAHVLVIEFVINLLKSEKPFIVSARTLLGITDEHVTNTVHGLRAHIAVCREREATVEAIAQRAIGKGEWIKVPLVTPDGVSLRALIVPARGIGSGGGGGGGALNLPPSRGTVLYIGGNAELAAASAHVMGAMWAARGFTLCVFDERGCGTSSGEPSRDGLIIDAATVLAFLAAPAAAGGAGVPPSQLLVLGHSLGGSLALLAAASVPGAGGVVSDRSFSSIADVAVSMARGAAPALVGRWGEVAVRAVVRHLACWDFDAVAAWKAVPTAVRKRVMWHDRDEIIPLGASLVTALGGAPSRKATPSGAAAMPAPGGAAAPVAADDAYDMSRVTNASAHNRGLVHEEVEFVLGALGAKTA